MSQATTVYRIEHAETKAGMYRLAGVDLYQIMTSYGWDGDQDRHPSPESDSVLMQSGIPGNTWGLGEISHLRFGFASVDQLRSWLYKDEWLLGLHNHGYVLAIIETEEAYIGSTQAVFLRPEVYETVSIKEYFKLNQGE